MKINPIATAKRMLSHPSLSHVLNMHGSLRRTPGDEYFKTQSLQRWENEGGRIAPKPQPASNVPN